MNGPVQMLKEGHGNARCCIIWRQMFGEHKAVGMNMPENTRQISSRESALQTVRPSSCGGSYWHNFHLTRPIGGGAKIRARGVLLRGGWQ